MAIVSSTIIDDAPQRDGRRAIRERHVDQVGRVFDVAYLGAANVNAASVMAARVPTLNAGLIAGEIADNLNQIVELGSLAIVSMQHSTVAQNAAAIRVAYQIANQREAVMLGDFLSSLSDARLQTAFGLTAGQVTTLRTNKLTPAATLAASIRAAVGQ